ncbi:MAG: hypothetical protein AAGE94_01455 [Acidobacteriota bacterium]
MPVAVDGTYLGIPRATDRIRSTRVRVAVGQPIDTASYGSDDRRRLAQDVHAAVEALHAGLRERRGD